MINFPVPYPDELVYSTVARAGIHVGITSPKQLLEVVFNDRKIIATVDLPTHLKRISRHYPASLHLTAEALVYLHTLFPLYAPFVNDDRKKQCLTWMAGESSSSVHLVLGVVASRIKQERNLRYCPDCLKEQLYQYGEYFWLRKWQVAGSDCCLKHDRLLLNTSFERHNYHRHCFEALSDECFKETTQSPVSAEERRVTALVNQLLSLPKSRSPSFEQWALFYRSLAVSSGCIRGSYHIQYSAIKKKILSHWSWGWLKKHDLPFDDNQSSWLRSIFRKHRKAFSYLEHIVVIDAFHTSGWQMANVLKDVLSIRIHSNHTNGLVSDIKVCNISQKKRKQWKKHLREQGVQRSRDSGGGVLYAWLYRNDRDWLLKINSLFRKPNIQINNRVDWNQRDRNMVKALINKKRFFSKKSDSPRRSTSWLLSQISSSSTILKNLDKLPLTNMFLVKHSESIAFYQVRRVMVAIQILITDGMPLKRCKV
jgi:hypothetical protein